MLSDKKHYPPTVKLKKIWIGLAFIAIGFVATIVFYNILNDAQRFHTKKPATPIQTAHQAETKHYQEQLIEKATSVDTNAANTTSAKPAQAALPETFDNLAMRDPNLLKAMASPIGSNQMVAENTNHSLPTSHESRVNGSRLKPPASPYVIQAGTFIPSLLITGINSDLPGQIISQVRANVYDSTTGRYLLIPQGSKMVGVYDAKIIYGQERVLVAWQRLILPNGQSMDLPDMPGVDNSGYAGFSDGVDAHYTKLLSSAVLMSVLGAGAQYCQPPTHQPALLEGNTLSSSIAQPVGMSLVHTAAEITNKNVNLQPTLEIRPGYTFNVSVTSDLVFPKPYTDNSPSEVP